MNYVALRGVRRRASKKLLAIRVTAKIIYRKIQSSHCQPHTHDNKMMAAIIQIIM